MSRSATATPPQTYFPQKVTTSSVRHAAPVASTSHTYKHTGHHSKRSRKHAAGPSTKAKSSGVPSTPMEMSFEDVSVSTMDPSDAMVSDPQNKSTTSLNTFESGETDETQDSLLLVPTPAASFYSQQSIADTPLVTPNSSDSNISPLELVVYQDVLEAPSSNEETPRPANLQSRGSWTSNIGKMAKAVVHTGKSMGMSFGERKKRDSLPAPRPQAQPELSVQSQVPMPLADTPTPVAPAASESLENVEEQEMQVDLSMVECRMPDPEDRPQVSEAILQQQREQVLARHARILELARLCSQWPYSGYQRSKFGPNGNKAYYEPISYANPKWVRGVMEKQAALEQHLCRNGASHFTCRRDREGSYSDDGSDQSVDSYMSSQSSPTASIRLEADQKTKDEIEAAMGETIIDQPSTQPGLGRHSFPAQPTTTTQAAGVSRSISELDTLANSMQLMDQGMDLDRPEVARSIDSADVSRHERGASSGSKRPLQPIGPEEEKRRKVDEAMVVGEAVSSGVIQPSSPGQNRSLSSTSGSTGMASAPAMFGHVVKTSDTHPIIISPFFPTELLPVIAANVVLPTPGQMPLMVSSQIDVAQLLLAYTPNSSANSSALSSPVATSFGQESQGRKIGNLLLSSCPGKRLRMEGPVKGRPPVCRDLETDLRRIKSEGVGCLVCCLDDAELALLGVPWATYHSIASKIGLDVIRMPMPDGFTPASVELFDTHVSLICEKYTLEGINVLVHCRGGVGRAGLTASAWAIKMGFVTPHPSFQSIVESAKSQVGQGQDQVQGNLVAELEHRVVMSMVERVIAMIRCRRGLKAIESFEQVQFLAKYVGWLRIQGSMA